MTIAQKQRKWTVDEFFAWNEHQEEKYELVDGVPMLKREPVPIMLPGATAPVMMTGASRRHNMASGNLFSLVGNQLRGGPCKAFANDAAVKTGPSQIRFPDLVVDCGTKIDDDFIFENPKLVAEVLSPSTRTFDLAGKITEYWQIATIAHVLIIDPEKFRVQIHTRRPGEAPTVRIFSNSDDSFEIPEIGVTLKLADIFEGLVPVMEQ
ncbi:Uma2 family endonuclease [Mesorhizobium sp. ASY16-5R]|uniref:Uma2 family endonuclease n=1 Tax=Mesorhizobium sp. ASY16-5R TaxID=3445772 RepID=UPI003F9EEFDF